MGKGAGGYRFILSGRDGELKKKKKASFNGVRLSASGHNLVWNN